MPIADYISALSAALSKGNATEHTHRPALKSLIEALKPNTTATNEPRRVAAGAPDFVIANDNGEIGQIECKDVGESLDKAEKSEQLSRYIPAFGNLILTDYFEFRWYRGANKPTLTARLGTPDSKGRIKPDPDGEASVLNLLNAFLASAEPPAADPQSLAKAMAAAAQNIRVAIAHALKPGVEGAKDLREQITAFRDVLLDELTDEQFADMYAQTICYGLFAARCLDTSGQPFNRASAAFLLPKTNPFLQKLFVEIAGPGLDDRVKWAVDRVVDVLANARMADILKDFGRRTRQTDPVLHFYETFLASYDAKMREARGVYYTPEPVVDYIVRSIDALLKRDFGVPAGLADTGKITHEDADGEPREVHRVLILDPATGTGTFLHGVIDQIASQVKSTPSGKAMWPAYVREHLLPRLFGFELLMAPYTVAHMKLGLQLRDLGYEGSDRLGVYLTNTLGEVRAVKKLGLAGWLFEEASSAGRVKRDDPIMVVLGNPPYSGHSENKGEWIHKLLRGEAGGGLATTGSYFHVDGKPLGEKNPKWLNDDYVKFIRFAQWRIEQTGHGILAFISNNGYIDNPTFRGMRQCLMESFDDIYILDLHGNAKKKERAPDGSKDENVFDIMQGVSIGIFVRKKSNAKGKRKAQVHHAELWGARSDPATTGRTAVESRVPEPVEGRGASDMSASSRAKRGNPSPLSPSGGRVPGKYEWLLAHDVESTKWKKLKPAGEQYLFIPRNEKLAKEYQQGWKITDAMPVNVLGFQTHRDGFAIGWDESEIADRIKDLIADELTDDEIANKYGIRDGGGWTIAGAREDARNRKKWRAPIISCLYRPFDSRKCYFDTVAMDRPRRELIDHVAGKENLCLNTVRQTRAEEWRHALVSDAPTPAVFVEIKDGSNVFPLYLYPNGKAPDGLFAHDNGRRPNFSDKFIKDVCDRLTEGRAARSNAKKPKPVEFVPDGHGNLTTTIGPEDIFYYAYAVFHSPGYRERYAEFLKTDFPRLPLTSDPDLFAALCKLGAELVELHLMKKDFRPADLPTFPVKGSYEVEKVRYVPAHTEQVIGPPTSPSAKKKKSAGGDADGPPETETVHIPGRVWINQTQYFEPVPAETWDFHIGGYRVCEKWLKDRVGRVLSYEDYVHYCRTVASLTRTMQLMETIDTTINAAGAWPLDGEET